MKRFRRWLRRHRWRGGARVLALIGGLVALDTLTKTMLVTPEWAVHHQPDAWLLYPALALVISAALIGTKYAIPAALLAATALGNGAWELTTDAVPNPFVIQSESMRMGFNLADLYALAAVSLVAIAFFSQAVRRAAV